MEEGSKTFQVWDYLVFTFVLAMSAGIGIYHGCTGGKQRTTAEVLLANRQMSVPPVAMSLLATFMSAITLLGTPTEVYLLGTIYWWIWIGYLLMVPFAAHVLIPVFYRLEITSVYEYFEVRFRSKCLRLLGASIYIFQMVLYLAIVLYAPSMALSQVTGLNVWLSVVTVGIVCTFYTSIGGMKAVMWTDTFQIVMMFAGLFAVLIQGSINKGGFGQIWQDNIDGGRVFFKDFDPNPLKRHTFWTLSFGGFLTWLSIYGINQAQVQRALSCSSLRNAQTAYWINLPGLTIIMTVTGLCGMVVYSEYKDCDPISNKNIQAPDQLLPFYVIEKLSHVPGVPGLFVSCVLSGTLSTISSGLNSLSAVILQDLVRSTKAGRSISEAKAATVSKVIVVLAGVVCISLTFVASKMGAVLQAALALFGVVSGPLLGVFILGILVPFANWIGALVGLLCGFIAGFWVAIGAQITKPYRPILPLSTQGCPVDNNTFINDFNSSLYSQSTPASTTSSNMSFTSTMAMEGQIEREGGSFYSLSYLHYSTLAVIVVCTVGTVVSLITGAMSRDEMLPKTLNPLADVFCPCLPQSIRDWLRCFAPREIQEKNSTDDKVKGTEDEKKELMLIESNI